MTRFEKLDSSAFSNQSATDKMIKEAETFYFVPASFINLAISENKHTLNDLLSTKIIYTSIKIDLDKIMLKICKLYS